MKKTKEINKNIVKKQPVVVVLGHVDHGKSSLLEAIKDFKITAKESGGITQHIGAYEVEYDGKKITFIDTPGHEAFSAMRTRGAGVADIALLVVDAAQSVQPQTKEAIETIRKSDIPMIVVLNKIDLPTAEPEKIKRELAKEEVLVETMGGETPTVNVSAKEKTGIAELLEMIILATDIKAIEANVMSPAEGAIIESHMNGQKGPVATAIVEKGILKKKGFVATETAMGKIRFLEDFRGKQIEEVLPGQAAVIFGFETVPAVGEKFAVYPSAKAATEEAKRGKSKTEITLPKEGQKTFDIILKGDYFGSLEAIAAMLSDLPQEQVAIRILKNEVGDINESDIKTAEMSGAQIIGFRVKISPSAMQLLKKDEKKKVRIKTFDIIYELVQTVKDNMEKSLEPEIIRNEIGKIKALIIFFGEKNRQIIGGKITDGEIKKGLKLDIFRNDPSTSSEQAEKIGAGKIINLQRDKKDVDKLSKGSECGILFEGNVKVEQGDILVAYAEERRKGEL